MLEKEVEAARKEIVADGYDMSIGELINIFKDGELDIAPEYQRLFRWDEDQKTRFIETLLLGLPIPPIFVSQKSDGKWELIDGLQRTSTILQFIGILPSYPALELGGTKYLPSLANKYWDISKKKDSIGKDLQLQIKRQRLRVEILKKESDSEAKYELFQRLNTGGSKLSEQEVRNCVAIMLNSAAAAELVKLSEIKEFVEVTNLSDEQKKRQYGAELVLRHFTVTTIPYKNGLDVHAYLDEGLHAYCKLTQAKRNVFSKRFSEIYSFLNSNYGAYVFRTSPTGKSGQFQLAKFEVVLSGLTINWQTAKAKDAKWLKKKIDELHKHADYNLNSGAGVRGSTRMAKLLPFSKTYFAK